jgi:hypothetical protein
MIHAEREVSVVRIVDRPLPGPNAHIVTVEARVPGYAPRTATVDLTFPIDPRAAEKLRWYLEDYAGFPVEPGPAMATESEHLQRQLGQDLFRAVFGNGDPRDLWTQATFGGLDRVRVEIDADPADAPGLPWELLRAPNGPPLVVAAGQFVRTHRQAAPTRLPAGDRDRLRVLLVICRPDGRADVPFRSVASRLVRGGIDRLTGLELDVLRPATFAHLARVLRAARDTGDGYDVVHFDGHGTYRDVNADGDPVPLSATTYGPSLAAPARAGQHGYLLFEKPGSGANQQLVDGPTLADLLVETQVSVLVLNACRSAYAEVTPAPDPSLADVHERVRAYGSLAAEVADKGVAGVVAMRYNVYVVTAAQFVADLYTHLLAGRTLGEAAAAGRRGLAADPTRALGAAPVNLQDWMVPTVYEAAPTPLVGRATGVPLRITLHGGDARAGDGDVPGAPDIGFFGRDDALLALDRAFDGDRLVLLHALAGAGKTTTAAEFTRWYTATGGLRHDNGRGLVLWTSFEHHMPLERVLDAVGPVLAPVLKTHGVEWDVVTDPAERRSLVLQVLALVPVLWVWDNVEPVTGFPTGTASAWTVDEQAELRDFLRALRDGTRAKVLLTSRRDEHPWLGELCRRVVLAPMPMRERLQLVRALAARLGAPPDAVDWRVLARFSGGNPLTVAVLVRQALLREHVATTAQVEAFVARIEAGARSLEPAEHADLGRSGSLAASLAYGFTHAFTEREQARLALLHLFRETVGVLMLQFMASPLIAERAPVPALAGADPESLGVLLRRAAELGLLVEYGRNQFIVHPALPWFFSDLFARHVADAAAAERAFVHAYAVAGHHLDNRGPSLGGLLELRAEEANLRHALHLARTHHLRGWAGAGGCLQALRRLYSLTGRLNEWARLVTEIQYDYLDPDTAGPRPGEEDTYSIITQYLVQIAMVRNDWPEAVRLQAARTVWNRDRAAPYLDLPPDQLDHPGRERLLAFSVSEMLLSTVLRHQDDPACRDHARTAYDVAERHGDPANKATTAAHLGRMYLSPPGPPDLDQADRWLRHSLDLTPEDNVIGRAVAYTSLAEVALARFRGARDDGAPAARLAALVDEARVGFRRALELAPLDSHQMRGGIHELLGELHLQVRDLPGAFRHHHQSLRHAEAAADTFRAGVIRLRIALVLHNDGRYGDALLYARASLTDLLRVGPGAAAMIGRAEAAIQDLGRKSAP